MNNSLEAIAEELYHIVKDLKNQSSDSLVVEAANRAIKRYEQIKANEDFLTPMLPGYEHDLDDQESLFEYAS